MENVKLEQKDGELVIRIKTNHRGGVSGSGKSITVASTKGNKGILVGDTELTIGVNVFIPNPDYVA